MQHYRGDRGIMERICPWGVGHPDLDDPCHKSEYGAVHGGPLNPYTKTGCVCSKWQIDGVDATWITKETAITLDGRVWSFVEPGGTGDPNYDIDPVRIDYIQPFPEDHYVIPRGMAKGIWDVDDAVLAAWCGAPPLDHEPHHIDGDLLNNNLSNLEWRVA